MKKGVLCLKCLQNKCQKQVRTSELFAQEKRMDFTTKTISSIVSFRDLWLKEVILPLRMEPVEQVFMERNLQMNKFGSHILTREFFQWLMLVKTQMAHNSSSASEQLHIWIRSMSSLVESY